MGGKSSKQAAQSVVNRTLVMFTESNQSCIQSASQEIIRRYENIGGNYTEIGNKSNQIAQVDSKCILQNATTFLSDEKLRNETQQIIKQEDGFLTFPASKASIRSDEIKKLQTAVINTYSANCVSATRQIDEKTFGSIGGDVFISGNDYNQTAKNLEDCALKNDVVVRATLDYAAFVNQNSSQKPDVALIVGIIVAVVVIAIIGGIGYWQYKKNYNIKS